MDAAADYAAALRQLTAPLPAYVTYQERSYASAGPVTKDATQTVVIRTRDGAVLKGSPQKISVSVGKDERVNPVSRSPFNPACYAAVNARERAWNGHPVEAIALHDTCHARDEDRTDFTDLYVDPMTHRPLVVLGDREDDQVSVALEQRYADIDGHVLPSRFTVHLVGHGIVGFLNVSGGQDYGDYRFSATMP